MTIRTRRWNDARQPGDGFRLLVCRYRPRGVRKADETWDAWWKDLGPSIELILMQWAAQAGPDAIAARMRWRDRRLAALKAHHRAQPAG